MYKECVSCPKLGVSCDGPNFASRPAAELISWCKARKEYLGLTNGRIAEMAGMSKGTVDGLFANAHADFRFETIRPVLRVLVGGEFTGMPCPEPSSSEKAAYEERIRHLEAEVARRDEKIKDLSVNNEDMKTLITNSNKRHEEQHIFLRQQIRNKNRVILILSTLYGICLSLIIAALVVDILNPEIGFFWLRGLFYPQGVQDFGHITGEILRHIHT